MKKVKLFILAFVAMAGVVMTSCNPEENTPPTISINGITDGGTYTLGSVPAMVAVVGANDAELSTLAIDVTGSGLLAPVLSNLTTVPAASFETTPTTSPFAFVNNSQNVTVTYTPAISQAGTFTIRLIATDKNDEATEVTVTFTVTAGATFKTYNNITVGSYSNATVGSSFVSLDGTVLGLTDAKANSAKVDLVYFYGATNLATLAAPSETTLNDVFTTASGMSSWTTRNATKLALSALNAAAFDAITTNAALDAAVGTPSVSLVNQLSVGSVVSFQTAATSSNPSKKGLLKVTNITGAADGTMTFSVKILN